MKIIGKRKSRSVTKNASGELLIQGALFNDEMHRLPTGSSTGFPKGIYRYKTHEAANAHWELCLAEGIAKYARG